MKPEENMKSREEIMETFGVEYYEPGDQLIRSYSGETDGLYSFQVYLGRHDITIGDTDSVVFKTAKGWEWQSHGVAQSFDFAVRLMGYKPPEKTAAEPLRAHLPYVNGCSTAQIFPPLRSGDPTLQWLNIPPFSEEQAHHIHSTVRVVYIASGKGRSIVGMEGGEVVEELYPGKVVVLKPMCPHHFDTPQGEHLVCVPLHIFSSTPAEFGHPMFLGTHLMNQGE